MSHPFLVLFSFSFILIDLLPVPELISMEFESYGFKFTCMEHQFVLGKPVIRYRPYLSVVTVRRASLFFGQLNETLAATAGLFDEFLTVPDILAAAIAEQ